MTIEDLIKHLKKERSQAHRFSMSSITGGEQDYYLGMKKGINSCIISIKLHLKEQIAHERIEKL